MVAKTFEVESPTLVFNFANKEAAKHFKLWLCGQGEQDYWDWMRCREDEEKGAITGVDFDYHKNHVIDVKCGRIDVGEDDQ